MTVPIAETTSHTDLTVRKATGGDLPAVADTLTAAFFDDPVIGWWMPDEQRRASLLRAFFDVVAEVNHPHDGIYLTGPMPTATSVWIPPGCLPDGDAAEQVAGWMFEAAEETAERLGVLLELMDAHHPSASHAYLFVVGARPQWRCRGLGSALLHEVLHMCDRDGVPAYLEATSPASRRLYLRHGFEVTGEIQLPDGPSLWPMWRTPQPNQ